MLATIVAAAVASNGSYGATGATAPIGVGLLFVLAFLIWFGFHIWAIVDAAVAPPAFYQNYPNG